GPGRHSGQRLLGQKLCVCRCRFRNRTVRGKLLGATVSRALPACVASVLVPEHNSKLLSKGKEQKERFCKHALRGTRVVRKLQEAPKQHRWKECQRATAPILTQFP
ncbi:hypothetical protein BaRGS_00011448, partial [Batillaria attramentaria]